MAVKKRRRAKTKRKTPKAQENPFFPPELADRFKNAADAVLGAIERDPEKAIGQLGVLGGVLKQAHDHLREHPEEGKKLLKNAALVGLARAIRKNL
jgi:hypothetical protein